MRLAILSLCLATVACAAVINSEKDGACSLFDGATGVGCTPYPGYLPPSAGNSYSVQQSGATLMLNLHSDSACGSAPVGNTYSVSPSSPYAGVWCCGGYLTNPNLPPIACLRYWNGEDLVPSYTLSQFSVSSFNALPWYEDVRHHAVGAHSATHIKAILDIVEQFSAQDWLGVSLLHKHFELLDGEVLLEKLGDDHTSMTQPSRVSEVKAPLPYMFSFGNRGQVLPLEYIDDAPYHVRQNVFTLFSNTSRPLLAQVHEYLVKHNLVSIFGLSISHRQTIADADPHGRQVETSDLAHRWQKIRPFVTQSEDEIAKFKENQQLGRATNTFWTVARHGAPSSLDCNSHCTAHCGVHCGACCTVH